MLESAFGSGGALMCGNKQEQRARLSREIRTQCAALAAIICSLFATQGAYAQPVPQVAQLRPDAGQILEQQRDRVPPPTRPDREVMPREEQPRPAMRGSASLKVTVKQFRITGNQIYSEAELQPTLRDS